MMPGVVRLREDYTLLYNLFSIRLSTRVFSCVEILLVIVVVIFLLNFFNVIEIL